MRLHKLTEGLEVLEAVGSIDIDITGIAYDSRKAGKGYLFVCIDGTVTDGHKYIPEALENGAAALLVQKKTKVPDGITVIRTVDTRYGLAHVSDRFFEHPSARLNLAGVTGTKGKTTTTYMMKSILEQQGQRVGLIGTVEKLIGDKVIYMERTTPESHDLQSLLGEMVESGVQTAVMEVSSQGLKLHRVSCNDFDIGIFTNISRAHIGPGEHGSFKDYLESKIKLFRICGTGLVNIDAKHAEDVIEGARCDIMTFGIRGDADIRAGNIEKHADSVEYDLETPWFSGRVKVGVPGEFSVYNSLGAIGAAALLGSTLDDIRKGLENISVRGRVETVKTGGDYTVIIDYAHSPDSLRSILQTVRDFAPGRVVCLFGCGGDRDRMMRPMMGSISGELADFTIITSDNPRTEEPEAVTQEIEKGIRETDGEYNVIVNRRQAIRFALENARKNDIIVLAGKGHETYQTFRDKTIHFDEREVVKELLNELRQERGKG